MAIRLPIETSFDCVTGFYEFLLGLSINLHIADLGHAGLLRQPVNLKCQETRVPVVIMVKFTRPIASPIELEVSGGVRDLVH